jgi:hypothetical protein
MTGREAFARGLPSSIAILLLVVQCTGCRTVRHSIPDAMNPRPIAEVLSAHTPELMRIEGVLGTGEGARDGKPAFLVLVHRDTPALRARIPATIEGYRVIVREIGAVRAEDSTTSR